MVFVPNGQKKSTTFLRGSSGHILTDYLLTKCYYFNGTVNYTDNIAFHNHMSVHCNIIPNYSQQHATFLNLFIFTDAVHVSGGSSIHHQEHITVPTASGIVNQYCC